ncbi:MAG: DNA repair protein RadC [Pseudomonadota bacterium]
MAITDWPPSERPREKLLSQGASTLSDGELLAIFLRTGCHGKSAVALARELLLRFNGLRPLLEADRAAFCGAKGLGDAKYCQLQAVLEMSRRHLGETLKKNPAFSVASEVKQFVIGKLRHQAREVFAVLFLDNHHHLLAYEELFYGTINSAVVYPREIAKRALALNTAAIILAHNHPSGIALPSDADKQITAEIKHVLKLLDVRLLDHLIVGDSGATSMAELGFL